MGNLKTMEVDNLSAINGILDRYSITKYGANEFTVEAAKNVLCLHGHFESVLLSMGGTLTSAYRSPGVNAKAGGSATSRHMQGLAIDFFPGKVGLAETFNKLSNEILHDQHGRVRTVILEPSWIHIDWHCPPWERYEEWPVFMIKNVDAPGYTRIYQDTSGKISAPKKGMGHV